MKRLMTSTTRVDIVTPQNHKRERLRIGGSLQIGGRLQIGGSLQIGGRLRIRGHLQIGGSLRIGGHLRIGRRLLVEDTAMKHHVILQ